MVQRNRDIEQDLRDILRTRERMTEKIESLKTQIRGAARQTQYQLGQTIDEVKQTAEGFKHTLNPYYQMEHHAWVITAGVVLLGSFYDLLRKALPGRA